MANTNTSSAKKKSALFRMTWKEVQEAFAKNPTILIPMGSIEQHGPQTPTGDYRYMDVVSDLIAQNTGAIHAPTIPWGYSEYFKHFPGCLTLKPDTLKAILFDTLDGFLRYKLDHFVFVCGHKGDMPILEQVAREIKDQHHIRIATIEPLSWLTGDFMRKVYGVEKIDIGHGSDPMTSIAMHLFPDDVRMDLLEKGNASAYAGMSVKGMSCLDFQGFPAYVYLDTNEIAPNGVLGDASHASAEAGKACVERMVKVGSDFVNWFTQQTTRC